MAMEHHISIILAAGESKRMKSKTPKCAHEICGKALIEWVYQAVSESEIKQNIIVIGHGADGIKNCMGDRAEYVLQQQRLGTGHAVLQAQHFLGNKQGYAFILYGDTPLITSKTISDTIKFHKDEGCSATIVTAEIDDPEGYGRIIRDAKGDVVEIVEEKDCCASQKAIKEVNSGMYCFSIQKLNDVIGKINNKNNQGEYYLTDTIGLLVKEGLRVGAFKVEDANEIMGVNDRIQLSRACGVLRKRILDEHMKSGVTIIDPENTYIDAEVEIDTDTVIYPGTIIEGRTKIGEDCLIGPNSKINNCVVGNNVEINNSVVIKSSIGNDTKVGPFAYIRPESSIGENVKIGDFVEIKKSVIGDKTKISHLSYIGDAEVKRNVNIGCGVVVVNYDGKKKHKTVIGNNAFIGCNVNLVSPVEVEDDTYIAAGSTITKKVPQNSLAVARSRQVNMENWVIKTGKQRKE